MVFGNIPNTKFARGKKYQETFSTRSAEKRVIPRTANGTPEPKDFLQIRKMEEVLSRREAINGFVGISYRGSSARGYSKPGFLGFKKSDLDMSVIVDPGIRAELPNATPLDLTRRENDSYDQRGFGKKPEQFMLHYFSLRVLDANGNEIPLAKRIVRHIEDDQPGKHGPLVQALAAFCEDMIGPRVKEYRTGIAHALATLPLAKRAWVVDAVTATLVDYERDRIGTIQERIPGALTTVETEKSFLTARATLWRNRVIKIFNVTLSS